MRARTSKPSISDFPTKSKFYSQNHKEIITMVRVYLILGRVSITETSPLGSRIQKLLTTILDE